MGVQYPTQIWDEELGLSNNFCVVIAGEYNAGKSTLINALLGNSQLLPMGVLPTTDSITILSSGSSYSSSLSQEQHNVNQPLHEPENTTISENETATTTYSSSNLNVIHYRLQNVPLLQDLTLIDTPGTNAIYTNHANLTMQLLPWADVILFVTAADRPFSESERCILESISKFRKSIVVVINKIDVLEQAGGDHGQSDKERVKDFVVEHVSSLLGARPIVLSVSARLALAAKQFANDSSSTPSSSSSSSWRRSNFESLEDFLEHTFTVPTKIQAKLSSPVGVAQSSLGEIERELQNQREKLKSDLAILHLLQVHLEGWRRELDSDMELAARTLSDILTREGERGHIFLQRLNNNSMVELYRLFCMESSDRVQHKFAQTKPISVYSSSSTASARGELESCCRDISEQMATRGRAQGQCMIEVLGAAAAAANTPSSSLVGSVVAASRFEETRTTLESNMLRAVTRNIDSDANLEREEFSFLDHLKYSVWFSLGMNVSSLVLVFATAIQIVDVTIGLGVGTCLVAAGVSSFTMRTRQIADKYNEIWKTRSQRLDKDIRDICVHEAERVERRISAAVAPYTRRIEAEQKRIDKLVQTCDELTSMAQRLRKQIGNLR